ncbi:hypothetical protein LEN26_013704 [Aphanomyces euteiches]|nr:hypothetical protein LEN26_013704 [Aphanomyces euteiches]KAH9122105.1 hypothetical protein AeMF1_006467 [Aphanomyces euteiches]KAH9181842.1 hypothetical protein AeNC1_016183 [Aphanomyces euteiches]
MAFKLLALSAAAVSSVSAIDYLGGWKAGHEQCVDICVNSNPKPGCFNSSDTNCTTKKQRPGDYDYLLLDQIFAPQFCRDLLNGNDSTITHQNVNPYPVGIQCDVSRTPNGLYVHGLWPNYFNGYPGCCNVSETTTNKPFNAKTFQTKYPALFDEMDKLWRDPAVNSSAEGLCHAYNHEFQKHGVCYRAFGDDWDKSAKNYFESTIDVVKRLSNQTAQFAKWAADKATANLTQITALYSKNVAVLCSKYDKEKKNCFLAVRTCWEKPADDQIDGVLPGVQRDCASTTGADACDPSQPITFDAYVPPRSSC